MARHLPGISRRTALGLFGRGTASALALAGAPTLANSFARPPRTGNRPQVPSGLQVGDLQPGRAMVWARSDRPARMLVRWSTRESMADAVSAPPVHVLAEGDFTGRIDLAGLPADQRLFIEVTFLDLDDYRTLSEPVRGSFLTPPDSRRDVRFVWSGDTAGQGWGINPDFGGMRIYETMRTCRPDFFIHSGDTIYADSPIESQVALEDGSVWRNLTTPQTGKVAETLDEFRGRYRYNLMDEPLRRFHAEVPVFAQWDDHEVTNNWYWEMRRDDDARYREGSVAVLAARAMRAFREYQPVRRHPLDPERLYQRFGYGPLLDVFRIDLRSYRGPNSDAQPTELSPEFRILGRSQLDWLKQALKQSTATWKVIASDMPLGLVIFDDWETERGAEGIALRDGAPAGRELEIARLLTFIRDEGIRNLVWLTADVHYTAAHYYDPAKARYPDFAPFWEFVSGPLNAGTFGPNGLDDTFGPQLVYRNAPTDGRSNLPPSEGMQFFGQVDIDGDSAEMTVRLKDLDGATLHTQRLAPEIAPSGSG
jgi:alkaline phosphatase D